MYGYEHICVKIGKETLPQLDKLKVTRRFNDHARVYITGKIAANKRDEFIDMIDDRTNIEVHLVMNQSIFGALFRGLVTRMELKSVNGVQWVEIQGVSATYELDIKKRSRSFQDKEMTYRELVRYVINPYNGADCNTDIDIEKQKTGKFIIQYQESDWGLLKRLASRFNTGLLPETTAETPKFWLGMPEGKEYTLTDVHYNVRKKAAKCRKDSTNYIDEVNENEYLHYQISVDEYYNIGDVVNLKGKRLIVSQCIAEMIKGALRFRYVLTTSSGIKQKRLFNSKLAKVSLEGKVIDVKKDHVRLHLRIDVKQEKEKAYWFPCSTSYSAQGNTGWYCMPELNDSQKLYFPSVKEEEAVAITSVRQGEKDNERLQKPEVKYFRTKDEKEMKLAEKELTISSKDNALLIRLDEEFGVEIFSKKDIFFDAGGDLTLEVGNKLEINAKEIDLKCKSSEIEMDKKGIICINGRLVGIDKEGLPVPISQKQGQTMGPAISEERIKYKIKLPYELAGMNLGLFEEWIDTIKGLCKKTAVEHSANTLNIKGGILTDIAREAGWQLAETLSPEDDIPLFRQKRINQTVDEWNRRIDNEYICILDCGVLAYEWAQDANAFTLCAKIIVGATNVGISLLDTAITQGSSVEGVPVLGAVYSPRLPNPRLGDKSIQMVALYSYRRPTPTGKTEEYNRYHKIHLKCNEVDSFHYRMAIEMLIRDEQVIESCFELFEYPFVARLKDGRLLLDKYTNGYRLATW